MALQAQSAKLEITRDARGGLRRKLNLLADASTSNGASATVTIHNLSETGLLIETSAEMALGDRLEVDLPHAGSRTAEVVWNSEDLFGCKFEQRLSSAGVSAALLRGSFASLARDPKPAANFEPPIGSAAADELSDGNLSRGAKMRIIIGLALLSWLTLGGILAALIIWLL